MKRIRELKSLIGGNFEEENISILLARMRWKKQFITASRRWRE
mgnify:CR=1 FL=1